MEKNATWARTRRAIAATSGSSALSTTQPPGFVIRAITALTSASSGSVWMPWRSRWSALMLVSTLASLDSYPTPRSRIPPRAVSRTATSRSRRARIWSAPPGPVQSPASMSRSSTRIPSDVVVPTWRPASSRMCVMSRVTVLLPFVPLIETIGTWRSASRTSVGGVVRAAAMRASRRPRSRSCPLVNRADRAGETLRSASWKAASAISRARSAPRHGKDTIQWPGSDDRWTASPPRPSSWAARNRRSHATTAATPSGQSRAATRAPSLTSEWAAGSRCPNHVRRLPTATSTLAAGSRR